MLIFHGKAKRFEKNTSSLSITLILGSQENTVAVNVVYKYYQLHMFFLPEHWES